MCKCNNSLCEYCQGTWKEQSSHNSVGKHFRDAQPNAGEGFEDMVAATKVAVKKEIDWTKPIRWRAAGGMLVVKHVGPRDVCIECDRGRLYLVSKTSGKCTESGLTHWYVENIPEPKKERWINVYWYVLDGAVANSVDYTTREAAVEWASASVTGAILYLGAFQVA